MGEFWYETASPDRYELLRSFARENRLNPTPAEEYLHGFLTQKHTGYKWRYQHIIGDYIVDFVCLKERLVVEVDGAYHSEPVQEEDDKRRTIALEALGFHVIRFTNEEVLEDILDVLRRIDEIIDEYQ